MRIFVFFSSRRRHTRLQGDWSSDVCSSDLGKIEGERVLGSLAHATRNGRGAVAALHENGVAGPERRGEPVDLLQRSEEHTSELQSPCNLVCRLLLEKKKIKLLSSYSSKVYR